MTCDCLKGKVLGKRKGNSWTHNFRKSKRSCKYFGIKNHRFCFKYTIDFICCFDFIFNKTWNFVIILIQFSVK